MQIKRSLLTLYSCLLVVVPTAMILAVGVLTRDVVIILLPWVLGPILGVFTGKLWFSRGMLPKKSATAGRIASELAKMQNAGIRHPIQARINPTQESSFAAG